MELKILSTDGQNRDFLHLIKLLDEGLNEKYGELQKQYNKLNSVDYINDVIVIYKDNVAIACGAFKEYSEDTVELKRIFVRKEERGQGLSKIIVSELEKLAKEKGYKHAVLETGLKQIEAIGLYKNAGYTVTENYGAYVGNTNSVCMKKDL